MPESFYNQPMVERVLTKLTAKGGKAYVYGGFVRDFICLGSNERSGDIDVAMSMADFMALKDPADDIRKAFVLHEPHLLFMAHQIMNGAFATNSRPLVLRLKAEVQSAWGLSHPVGLTLFKDNIIPECLVVDTDLGFCEVTTDDQRLWSSAAFKQDRDNCTITILRCRDARDYARTWRRIQRFQATGYGEWQVVIPEDFRQFEAEATAILKAG